MSYLDTLTLADRLNPAARLVKQGADAVLLSKKLGPALGPGPSLSPADLVMPGATARTGVGDILIRLLGSEGVRGLLQELQQHQESERDKAKSEQRNTDIGRQTDTGTAAVLTATGPKAGAEELATQTMLHRNRVMEGAGVSPRAARLAGPQQNRESDQSYAERAKQIEQEDRDRNQRKTFNGAGLPATPSESTPDYLARGRAALAARKGPQTVDDGLVDASADDLTPPVNLDSPQQQMKRRLAALMVGA